MFFFSHFLFFLDTFYSLTLFYTKWALGENYLFFIQYDNTNIFIKPPDARPKLGDKRRGNGSYR